MISALIIRLPDILQAIGFVAVLGAFGFVVVKAVGLKNRYSRK